MNDGALVEVSRSKRSRPSVGCRPGKIFGFELTTVINQKRKYPVSNPSLLPKEDARFLVLRADAERNWREWSRKFVKSLEKRDQLNRRLDSAAESSPGVAR